MTGAYRLPWVPAPCPGEWLGDWLLRVGGVYEMHLRVLVLAGISDVRFVEPTGRGSAIGPCSTGPRWQCYSARRCHD